MESDHILKDTISPLGDLRDRDMRKPTLAQVSLLYSIGVVLLLYIGFRIQRQALYPGLLITEFILVLLPPLALLFIYKYDVRKVLRVNRISLLSLFLILLMMIFTIPVVGVFNLVNLLMIKQIFGKVIMPAIPAATNLRELLINVLVIAGSAGLCEEVMFRGVIQRGFERLGAVRSILITAFLFGLFHLDFQRFLGTFMLGALIGFIVYRTNSIFGGMFAHFTNNSIAVITPFIISKIGEMMNTNNPVNPGDQMDIDTYFSTLANMPVEQLIAAIVVWFIIIASCAAVLIGLIIAFIRTTSEKVEMVPGKQNNNGKPGLLWLIPGFLLISLMYIAEGFKLNGVGSGLADFLIRFMGIG